MWFWILLQVTLFTRNLLLRKTKGFRGMESVPGDKRRWQVVVVVSLCLLLTLALVVVVVVVVLASGQKSKESDTDQLNSTNGSQAVLRKLWPPPKPCPGDKSW